MRWTAEQAYDQLAPAVRGYFRGRGGGDPDDLTGDVFVNVTRGIGGFRGDAAALRRWVFTIAHNRLVDELRRAGHDPHVWTGDPPESASAEAAVAGVADEELLAALAQLGDDQREVVVLRFVADLPLKDVARIVGKGSGAVKMLQARGLARLGELLEGRRDA